MRKYCFHCLFIISVVFTACTKQPSVNYPKNSYILGLATPVELQLQETNIVLEDYFPDISLIDSFTLPDYLSYKLTGDDFEFLTITANAPEIPPLSELKVWAEGFPYSILLKRNRKIHYNFRFDPKGKNYKNVRITGSMNDWNPANSEFRLHEGIWEINLLLNPGVYEYQMVLDGEWIPDPSSPSNNSLLRVGNINYENAPKLYTHIAEPGIEIGFDQSLEDMFVFWENIRLDERFVAKTESTFVISLPGEARKMDRSFIRIWSYNENGVSNDLFIPVSKGKVLTDAALLTRADKHATILYFMMVDRFKNGNPDNDDPIDDPEIAPRANYNGGDLAGITQKIKDGYFTKLNINSIWLSPITQNPLKGFVEYPPPHRKYSGYHGYWPITLTTIDHRFGTEQELRELVEEAHSRDMNVILDYVSNHVHAENPLYIENPDWVTDLVLPDGTMNIRLWDEQRLTTWFEPFMPSLDFSIPEVVEIMSDSALYWIENYGLDGFRHDATKHVPTNFWRTLTLKIKERFPERSIYQIGETFGSRELIGSYIGSGLMDGKFDFNLYFDARMVFATEQESFEKLNNSIMESFSYFGHNSLMGNITGNHDMPRFISFASGALSFDENPKEAGWTREIKVEDPVGYDRLAQLLAFTMTIPGIPVIYYGDEIGMPGADDPDSRRMMRFENLDSREELVKETAKQLNNIRRSNMEFMYGDFQVLYLDDDTYAYSRTYFDRISIVAFNKSSEERSIQVEIPQRFSGSDLKPNFKGEINQVGNKLSIQLAPYSFQIITP
jgi:cyclomaltodextrinase / maltogenic alpha-amylase / neopullulanase